MPTSQPADRAHPLEIIAVFRRWPRSALRNLLYTALWSSLIALALALATCAVTGTFHRFPSTFGLIAATSNMVGFLIHGGLAGLRTLAPAAYARGGWPLQLCKLLVLAGCAVVGIALKDVIWYGADPGTLLQRPGRLAPLLPLGAATALVTIAVLAAIARRQAREAEAARQQEKIAEASRLLAEARLRALQAQIEPHFLYNTLANVVGLIGPAPDKARHMLEHLIDFLRASLSASRAEHATVGAECDLAGAYLDVLAVRLGARLRYRITVDDDCRALPVAPMLIQPLVENAVMHGIEPKVAGGEVNLRARIAGDVLVVEVSDDGAGLGNAPPRPGGGVGLSNLRERLRSLHGPDARLELIENPAGGVSARLLLPLHTTRMVTPSNLSAP